jgi:chromosome partitioning protein
MDEKHALYRMAVISIAIQKGGSGKTTTAMNLAAAFRERGKNVLLIDLDPQCNLTQSMGIRSDPKPSMYDILDQEASGDAPDLREIIREVNGIPFAPASLELAKAELKLVSVYGREQLLKNLLAPLRAEYDHILIDCPPAVGMLTVNSLVTSDYVLMPMQAEYLPMKGLVSFMDILKKNIVGQKLNPALKILGILFTRYDPRNSMTPRIVQILSELYPQELLKTRIRTNIALAKAQENGLDIFRYDRLARGALDYMALAYEVEGRLMQTIK